MFPLTQTPMAFAAASVRERAAGHGPTGLSEREAYERETAPIGRHGIWHHDRDGAGTLFNVLAGGEGFIADHVTRREIAARAVATRAPNWSEVAKKAVATRKPYWPEVAQRAAATRKSRRTGDKP